MPLFSLLPGGGAAIPFVPLFTKACRRHSSALGRYAGSNASMLVSRLLPVAADAKVPDLVPGAIPRAGAARHTGASNVGSLRLLSTTPAKLSLCANGTCPVQMR